MSSRCCFVLQCRAGTHRGWCYFMILDAQFHPGNPKPGHIWPSPAPQQVSASSCFPCRLWKGLCLESCKQQQPHVGTNLRLCRAFGAPPARAKPGQVALHEVHTGRQKEPGPWTLLLRAQGQGSTAL